jgi:Holliday junction resolvasome RuvABC endonuclease subunit
MNILALDLGTKCGWAALDQNTRTESGVWDLKPSNFQSAGERFRKFREYLSNFTPNNYVVFEEVRNHRAVLAAQVYGGLVAILQTWCIDNGIEYQGVPVGTIKKYATGKGNADKTEMIKAANRLYPSINILDDNHADALCLLHYAQNNIIF